MVPQEDFKMKAIQIIRDYMGDTTANYYIDYYQKQNDKTVLESIKELLIEYVGNTKASEILISKGITVDPK